jgi:two-component system, OmpR family, sensor histidine kinase KdpD
MRLRIRKLRKELLRGRWLLELANTALSLLLVAGITGLIGIALHFYKIDHVTILYLIPVLVAALHWGVVPAVVAAIAGVAAPAFFFYPPIYEFSRTQS